VKVQDQVPYVKRAERENNLELDRVMFVPHGEYTKCHQVLYFLNGQNRNVYYVYFTTIKNKRWIVGGVAQVAVCLPGKCKALSPNPSTAKKRKRERERRKKMH
jgi:hypothetical protein